MDDSGDFGDGIHIVKGEVTITGNTIVGAERFGILLSNTTTGTLESNRVVTPGRAGLWAQLSTRATSKEDEFQGCTGYGVGITSDAGAVLINATIDGVAESPDGARDGVLVIDAAASLSGLLLPVPTGIVPQPARSAIVVENAASTTIGFPVLPEGVVVRISGTKLESQSQFGVVVQGDNAEAVDVTDDNDLSGALEALPGAVGLETFGSPAPVQVESPILPGLP